jgi:hypothetical protein
MIRDDNFTNWIEDVVGGCRTTQQVNVLLILSLRTKCMETGRLVPSCCERWIHSNKVVSDLKRNSFSQGSGDPYPHALEMLPRMQVRREHYSLLAKGFGLCECFLRVLHEGDSIFLQDQLLMRGGTDDKHCMCHSLPKFRRDRTTC